MTIWDTFSHTPGKTANGANGDVADDHYTRFRDDIDLLAGLGMKAYRFSIAWSRIMPTGRPPINPVGIRHYNDVIDYLTKARTKQILNIINNQKLYSSSR